MTDKCKTCDHAAWPGSDYCLDCYSRKIADQDKRPLTAAELAGPKEDFATEEDYKIAVGIERKRLDRIADAKDERHASS